MGRLLPLGNAGDAERQNCVFAPGSVPRSKAQAANVDKLPLEVRLNDLNRTTLWKTATKKPPAPAQARRWHRRPGSGKILLKTLV